MGKAWSNKDPTSDTGRATIGNYAQMHGTTGTLQHFKTQYPELKYTTICDWKKAIADEKKTKQPVTELKKAQREEDHQPFQTILPLSSWSTSVQYVMPMA